MHTYKIGGLALAVTLALAACGQSGVRGPAASTPAHPNAPQFRFDPTHAFVEGQVVVGLKDGASAEAAAKTVGGRVLTTLPDLRAALIALPQGVSPERAVKLFAGAKNVRYAEPNYVMTHPADRVVQAQSVPNAGVSAQDVTLNDPQLIRQWFLRNMNAPKAWETATGKGIRIGVADEDIDRHHPDLEANVVYPGFDSPNQTLITATTPYDGSGEHGTWVSGTAAAVGNNGKGGAGVAYQASIVPLTITHDPTGASNVDSARAFVFGVNGPDGKAPGDAGDTDTPAGHHGYVDILNYSFGGTFYSQLSKEAIDYVLSKGVVFVTSAGNTPTTGPASPAFSPGAISVAATTPRNIRTDFSNRGYHLSVAAPGQNIWTTAVRDNVNDPNEVKYEYVDGTSFASPATAGAAALILQASATKNPDGSAGAITLAPAQVRHVLEGTAYKPSGGYSLDLGNGIVRADAATARATQDAANTVEKGVNVTLRFVADSDNSVGIPLVGVTLSGGKRPDQLLYAQSGAGDGYFPSGTASFREIDAGLYQLYASGPRTVIAGGDPALLSTPLTLRPGRVLNATVPLPVTLPKDAFEPNNSVADAKPITYGDLRDGVMDAGDQDVFKFNAVKGDVAFLNTQTIVGNADLRLTILDAAGKALATNDNQRDGVTDAALDFTVPADGTYYVQVDSVNTGNPFDTYWVSLSKLSGSETEPNGTGTAAGTVFSNLNFAGANALGIGQALNAAIKPASDIDIYTFTGTKGQNIVADINATVSGEPDTVMALYKAGSTAPLQAVDDTNTQDATVDYTLEEDGTYYLAVAAYTDSRQSSEGDYRISLTQR